MSGYSNTLANGGRSCKRPLKTFREIFPGCSVDFHSVGRRASRREFAARAHFGSVRCICAANGFLVVIHARRLVDVGSEALLVIAGTYASIDDGEDDEDDG